MIIKDLIHPWYMNIEANFYSDDRVSSVMSAYALRYYEVVDFPEYFVKGGVIKDISVFLEEFYGFVDLAADAIESRRVEVQEVLETKKDKNWSYQFIDQNGTYCFDINKNMAGEYRGTAVIQIMDRGIFDSFSKVLRKNIEKEDKSANHVYTMVNGRQGPEFKVLGLGGKEIERGNYTPEVMEGFDRIAAELVSKNPRGRLSILSGVPGSGKTHLIRGLVGQTKAYFIIVPQQALPSLVGPGGIDALISFKSERPESPMVLILEDADDALAHRERSDMSIISTLLNLGDGITGAVLDIRLLATTNRDQQTFDAAVMRPGRLSTSLSVNKLSAEQASKIFERLTGNKVDFIGELTLAEVYQKAYDDGWKGENVAPKPTRKMGFGS